LNDLQKKQGYKVGDYKLSIENRREYIKKFEENRSKKAFAVALLQENIVPGSIASSLIG